MKYILATIIASAAMTAQIAAASPIQRPSYIYFCNEMNFSGTCLETRIEDRQCVTLDSNWAAQIRSIRLDTLNDSLNCKLYPSTDCTSGTPEGVDVNRNKGYADMEPVKFDKVAKSYRCGH